MSIADYLMNYQQAPKLKTNYAANALQNLQQSGNPFAGIASAFLSPFAAKTDRDNAQAIQQYAQQNDLANTLMNWGRQDELAQRQRNWDLQDAQTARENKLADALEQYRREDEVAQRNRDWSLADAVQQYSREDEVAQRQRDWALDDRKALWDREDQIAENAAAAEAKKVTERERKKQDELEAAKIRFQNAQDITGQLKTLIDKATYSPVGRKLDRLANAFGVTTEGAEAEERYRQIVNNEMIPRIREYMGAAVTAEEGARVIGLLGDPTASKEKKRAALDSFLEAAERNLKNKQDLANGLVGVKNDNPLNL